MLWLRAPLAWAWAFRLAPRCNGAKTCRNFSWLAFLRKPVAFFDLIVRFNTCIVRLRPDSNLLARTWLYLALPASSPVDMI